MKFIFCLSQDETENVSFRVIIHEYRPKILGVFSGLCIYVFMFKEF